MASEQYRLGPESNRLNFPDSSAEPLSLSRIEVETLFVPLFDDTIENRPSEASPNSAAHLDLHQVPDSPLQTTTTVDKDGPLIESPTIAGQTASNFRQSAEDPQQQSVPQPADYDGNAFFNPYAPTPTVSVIVELSSRNLDPSNMHSFYQHHPSTHHWT